MFEPPISPKGPGCTEGLTNNDFIPFLVLKLMKVTTVLIGSPMLSNKDSKDFDPSFICAINKLNKSRIPIPRFFFIGDSTTVINE